MRAFCADAKGKYHKRKSKEKKKKRNTFEHNNKSNLCNFRKCTRNMKILREDNNKILRILGHLEMPEGSIILCTYFCVYIWLGKTLLPIKKESP